MRMSFLCQNIPRIGIYGHMDDDAHMVIWMVMRIYGHMDHAHMVIDGDVR